ncbi:4-(cytidine 5'-diphospho)-2-C-methyl-D-erythritol kinase [Apilactobacillus micheneri]|uniref:4-diphosphocytidyl-2-C-methyl-D-erythritol kinase n=1 Tax=Apilactobacillus micheneri TaxID=1899430 RepID=A0A9Q8ILW4_9LACO|nr:4-(cytidine 5'-diphospho)-2-C-methyl-D-erythritol kinase [Apilactobacillus micheneri]TPR38794.1 4-(cytidine 5'-diphospho)-2-C-methyl-D-erythritol kinase [Apilactobacillus micheneri]TPR41328.1 4-(cytidine 5'-diphospho)-2-C-methyl-D-erythritol kinase [Apilactobacillus micheneri]TPR43022.1 4-(cytidine 5'-diphospho)-2-C-methyl-D-erythritol kinase [Apilactobacillus micheneri]TPR43308.1 4-(cytidine 5'-diphospho)-2-C-methyl-D-erythritol kinase [Apilactobacillus micheneri]TPR43970.1 4-(cytidine 5'-
MRIVEKARAKLNLGLDTLYRHKDGSPEWNMIMTSIDLSDYVEIITTQGNSIHVSSSQVFLPHDQRNLAYQAALLMKNTFDIKEKITINIKKNIPVAAGLGGGSSDAAAVIRGLNRIWNLNLSLKEMAVLGLKLDSDVPYCIYSKTAQVTGKGEIIKLMPKLPNMYFVLVKPRISVSTPEILSNINYDNLKHVNINGLIDAVKKQDYPQIAKNIGNVLEPISSKKYQDIFKIKAKFIKYGADNAQMSGTGPSVFGLCKSERHAKHIFNSIRGFCSEVYIVKSM